MYNIHNMYQLAMLHLHPESLVSPFPDCFRLSTDCCLPATLQAMCTLTLNIKRRAVAGKDFADTVTILSICSGDVFSRIHETFLAMFTHYTAHC